MGVEQVAVYTLTAYPCRIICIAAGSWRNSFNACQSVCSHSWGTNSNIYNLIQSIAHKIEWTIFFQFAFYIKWSTNCLQASNLCLLRAGTKDTIQQHIYLMAGPGPPIKCSEVYTGCPRRNVPNFGRVFLMLKYTNITQNTYVQSWTVTEIMASEVWNFDSCYTLFDYHIKTGRNMWFL